eukprot:8754499-Ditylum_brightwellii.AAC.1
MAQHASPGKDNFISYFHEGFDLGPQGEGTGWSIVDNTQNSGKQNKENQGKATTKIGENGRSMWMQWNKRTKK